MHRRNRRRPPETRTPRCSRRGKSAGSSGAEADHRTAGGFERLGLGVHGESAADSGDTFAIRREMRLTMLTSCPTTGGPTAGGGRVVVGGDRVAAAVRSPPRSSVVVEVTVGS